MMGLKRFFSKDRLLRLGAFVIDMAVLGLLLSICRTATGVPDFLAVQKEIDAVIQMDTMEQQQEQAAVAMKAFQTAYNVSVVAWVAYEVVAQLLLKGQTLGKKVCGLRVVSKKESDGTAMTLLRVTLRSVIKAASLFLFRGIPIIIAWVYIFGNTQNRAGYDVFVGTKVVRTK